MALGGATVVGPPDAPRLRATDLRCEFLTDPIGIDVAEPRLSWRCADGVSQTAFRICAASCRSKLARGEADLWDSGRISSDKSQHIQYAGAPLTTHQPVFWSVQLWDQDGATVPPNAIGHWRMGLLDPADWQADWIGRDTPPPPETLDATWFWTDDRRPLAQTPPGERFFRRVFVLPSPAADGDLTAFVAAGDFSEVAVDGRPIGTAYGWADATTMRLPALAAGRHVIAAMARNLGATSKPAGLAVRLEATGKTLFSDEAGWRGEESGGQGWQSVDFDDSLWRSVIAWGATGMAPWGTLALHRPRPVPARWLRRAFFLDRQPASAIVSFCGLGWSELHVNGNRIGDAMLSPPLTDYDRGLTYVTYDITDRLRRGENVLGVVLGAGRYVALRPSARDFGWPKLKLRLDATFPDDIAIKVVSDADWQMTLDGPIRDAHEYDGEILDARMAMPGWANPGFAATGWQPVEKVSAPAGQLRAMRQPPTRNTDTLAPISVTRTGADAWCFDFGQNIAGICRLRAAGPAGSRVFLRHAERLHPDGAPDTANLRSALARDVFVKAADGMEEFTPRFTSHGFRYATAAGLAEAPALTALVMSDDLRRTGQFDCSDPMLTRIHEAAAWSVRNNSRSIRTDCPQRDERQGWLGDVGEAARGEAFLFDNAAFYAKFLADILDTQRQDGALSDIAPAYLRLYDDDVAWPAALGAIALTLHDQFGDAVSLAQIYPALMRWIDRMTARGGDRYGDWGAPGMTIPAMPNPMIAAAYLVHCLDVAAGCARRLGQIGAADGRADEAREQFRTRFQRSDGLYGDAGATSCILALAFDLALPAQRSGLADRLVALISAEGSPHPCFGLIGAQWVSRVLQQAGRGDLVHRMAVATTRPGLGYMIAQGATTLWELWDGDTADPRMSSLDHTMLIGDLIGWLYQDLAGIRPDPDHPGFARVILAPKPIPTLDWVSAAYDAMTGRIESAWRRRAAQIVFDFTVPSNVMAMVILPGAEPIVVSPGRHRVTRPA